MSWNYRLTKEDVYSPGAGVETVYSIREVYYDKDGKVDGWTAEPVYPVGETWAEFQKSMALYSAAALTRKSKVLDVTEGRPGSPTESKT